LEQRIVLLLAATNYSIEEIISRAWCYDWHPHAQAVASIQERNLRLVSREEQACICSSAVMTEMSTQPG
jgi:hypothetical protein